MRRIRFSTAAVMSFVFTVCWTWPLWAGTAAAADHSVKVTVIAIPGLSFLELEPSLLAQLPHFRRLAYNGAAAALNVRISAKKEGDRYLSFGAGAPGQSDPGFMAFNSGERVDGAAVEQLHKRYNAESAGRGTDSAYDGESGFGSGDFSQHHALWIPGIGALRLLNEERIVPGLLGELLERHHIAVSVYGNSDAGGERQRYAALMLMNRQGTVRFGNVGTETLKANIARPYGVQTAYERLTAWWQESPVPGVAVLELGDLSRLYNEREKFAADKFLQLQAVVLREMDEFIGRIMEHLQSQDRLWLLSPQVNKVAAAEKRLLPPLIFYEPGMAPGLLFSPTTRRAGIVSYADIAPSLLASFSLKPPQEMSGFPLRSAERSGAWDLLWRENETISKIYDLRPHLLYPFAAFEIAVLLAGLAAVWLRSKITVVRIMRWLRFALWCILVSPPVLLVMGWIAEQPEWVLIVFFLVSVAAISLVLRMLPLLPGLTAISAFTAAVIVFDGLGGEKGMRHSVLGYDPIIGARFYGIGNEFMGVYIGVVVLGAMALLQREGERLQSRRQTAGEREIRYRMKKKGEVSARSIRSDETRFRWISAGLAVYFAAAAAYLAAPFLGANAGGAIAATAACGVAWARHRSAAPGGKPRPGRPALLLAALLPAALGLLWLLNAALPLEAERHSHVGRALQLATGGRLDEVVQIALRKLAMNLHLIGVSVWSKVLIASLLAAAASLLRPWGGLRDGQRRYPHLMNGFAAIAAGGIVGLAVNDSGIVAAATMFVYAAVPLLLLNLQDAPAANTSAAGAPPVGMSPTGTPPIDAPPGGTPAAGAPGADASGTGVPFSDDASDADAQVSGISASGASARSAKRFRK